MVVSCMALIDFSELAGEDRVRVSCTLIPCDMSVTKCTVCGTC